MDQLLKWSSTPCSPSLTCLERDMEEMVSTVPRTASRKAVAPVRDVVALKLLERKKETWLASTTAKVQIDYKTRRRENPAVNKLCYICGM